MEKPTNEFIPFSLISNQKNPLLYMIKASLTEENEQERNAYYNWTIQQLHPAYPYDQKIDFFDPKYENILGDLIALSSENPELDKEEIKKFMQMLVIKHPDFLRTKNLDTHLNSDENVQGLKNAIHEMERTIDAEFFKSHTKKQLRYYLNDTLRFELRG